MNFVFRAYPSHPWLTDWTFEPRNCATAFRERNGAYFFQSQETVGRIAPHVESPLWALQIPAPQNSQINLLFNGFCAYLEQRKKVFSAEVFTPEPGIIWGRYHNIPNPVLFSDEPILETEGFQWIGNDESPALLAVRDSTFCLVTKSRIQSDAVRLAESFLDRDIEEYLQEELTERAGATNFFEQMAHHDSLAVISSECLMRSLRPAEGKIPLIWSQSADSKTAHFDINELYPLAMAWRHLDINIAEELVLCALKLQVSSGAIPVINSPHGTYSILEAPKPLLAKTAELVWKESKNFEFLNAVVPSLRRHIQWLLHHFDQKKRGLHCWQNRHEAIVPNLFETDLATTDLTVLLLTEIEALNHLREQSPDYSSTPPYFTAERESLEYNLLQQFWDPEESAFTTAFVRDKSIKVQGFPPITPLLWEKLSTTYRGPILDRIKSADFLPGGLDILSWRKSAVEDETFPLLQQAIILQTMQKTDPHGTLISDFARITLQQFLEWHTLSLEEHSALPITPVIAAYVLNIQHTHQYRFQAKGRVSAPLFKTFRKVKVDRFDMTVVAVTIFAILSIHTIYRVLSEAPPFAVVEARMNSEYTKKSFQECLNSCEIIIKHYPEQAAPAQLLAANILMFKQDFTMAIELLKKVRTTNPDSPGPMIILGLAYQLQNDFLSAEENYAEFCYLFDEIFPELVHDVTQLRQLMQEGFSSPPNWTEIYRYQLLHEL